MIDKVTDGHSLSDLLGNTLPQLKDPRDRAFVQNLCYGVCRYYTRLDVILSQLLEKPMKAKDSDVHALLLIGLYQLMDTRVPAHAAVAETVQATQGLKKPWARGLVNAVLREYQRKHTVLESECLTDAEACYAHPLWWISAIKKAWPLQWEAILHANNERPPFALRVNPQHVTRATYLEKLNAPTSVIAQTEQGFILEQPVPVEELPGFAQGAVSVQDGAAQLAAHLLRLAPNQSVLDACAAPGGKLTHILELEPKLVHCIAVESDKNRMRSIEENLARLNLVAECLCADASAPDTWWDGKQFDRILLDAPCSASGVIRRHPDIKLLRQPTDIKSLVQKQLAILEALWLTLAKGGVLLYATCSIFPAENTGVIKTFLAAHPDASEDKIEADWGVACEVGRQILPGMHQMDGFYYARLKKQ
jgi:16S rRNA (cytosine967-C5)-methyltransferase